MARRRKKRKRHADTMFAKAGSKENFWTPSGRVATVLWGKRPGRRSQSATLNISGAGSVDRDYADLGGGGRKTPGTIDISGAKPARGGGAVPAISGGGKATTGKVPDIGGDGRRSRNVPDIGGQRNVKGGGRVPEISGSGKANRRIPDIGGDGRRSKARAIPNIGGKAGAGGSAIDISGAVGSGRKRRGEDQGGGWRGRIRRSVAAQLGFRSLSMAEEREFDLFVRRAHQAGFEAPYRQILSWRANIMLGHNTVGQLWGNSVGAEIEARYGSRGRDLDLAETDRPKRTFIKRKEEVKSGGIRARFKAFMSRFRRRPR